MEAVSSSSSQTPSTPSLLCSPGRQRRGERERISSGPLHGMFSIGYPNSLYDDRSLCFQWTSSPFIRNVINMAVSSERESL